MVEVSPAFRRRLKVIPALITAEVRPVMEACADELVAMMQTLAPRDTGEGAASIGWTWGDAPKVAMVLDSLTAKKNAKDRIVIYAAGGDAFHMRFQEFGTVDMPAQPFFWPAYRALKAKIKRRIAAAVRRGVKKANV
ncbi:HK97 gp10 family phage protein [Sedimentimonas flavescens]|uniref:HK97 gp10 family phage protein n=1 Tax=Sedimentimonas flavescens TaxID=2851012 RepID=A0ABT2ZV41_9RHOB|nr:HK97-gp10 family putative phage morphogenesis protein [Sedimentimonas flavescens]MCV2877609.1 HK97 gp10 family phage protein [Sedimentimonas flavescens]